MQRNSSRLVLEDGAVFPGVSVGAPGVASGEACFTTAMTGYEEAVTDPSYVAQVLCFAYPLIGTYGVDESRLESERGQCEGVVMRDLTMENPIRAIREISHDVTGSRKVRLANGREASALDIQHEYLSKARNFVDRREISTPVIEQALDLWERGLKAVESDDLGLVERELDWVIKWKLIDRYRAKHGLPLGPPRVA